MATQQELLQLVIQTSGSEDVAALAKSLYDTGQSASGAAPKAQELLAALSGLASKDDLITTLTREKIALQETGDQLALAKIKLAELQTQLSATTTPSAALERSFAKQTTTVASLETAYTGHTVAIQKTSNALTAAGINTANLDSEQRKIQSSIGAVSEQAAGLGKNLGSVAVATEDASTKAEHGSTVFGALRTQLLEIVSVAAAVELALKGIEFGAESIKGAATVEASLVRVQALAGEAAGQFSELDEAVEKAAVAVNTTTQNAAGGLAALVAQGLSADKAISALIPTLQLAKIANIDVGTAAGEVAAVLKAFNVPAAEAQAVVDQLTVASHGAAGGLAGMATAAAQLAPDAKTLGLNLTQTVGILGLLQASGLDTEKALRGMRTIFQDLQDPTSALRVQLLALGDGTSDFGTAVAALTAKTPRAQQALLTLDGPARSLIETLGQAGPGALAQFTAGLQNAGGEASRTSAAIDGSLLGSYTKFINALDLVGEKLAGPILKPFADELTKLAGKLIDFSESPDFDQIVQKVSEMSTKAAAAIDEFVTNTDWKGFSDRGLEAISGIAKALEAMANNAKIVAGVIGKTGDGIGVAFHGAGTAIDGAVTVAAKFLDKVTDLTEAGDALAEGTDASSKKFENLHAIFESVADSASNRLGVDLKGLKDNALELAGASDEAAHSTEKQGEASTDAAPKIAAHAETTKTAADAQKNLGQQLGIVPDYLNKAGDAASKIVPPLLAATAATEDLSGKALSNAKKALSDAVLAFGDLQRAGNASPAALNAASQAVQTAARNLDQLQSTASGATGSLKTAFAALRITSQEDLKAAADAAQAAFNAINAGAANTAEGLADRQNAFLAYASRALAASAQLGQGQRDSVAANLQSQAAILGVTNALKNLETQSDSSAAALVSDSDQYAASLKALGDKMHANEQAYRDAGAAANYAGGETKAAGDAADDASKKYDGFADTGEQGFADLTQAIANTRLEFLQTSPAAAAFYDTVLDGAFKSSLANDDAGAGFDRVSESIAVATKETTDRIANQRTQLQGVVSDINNVGTASGTGFGQFGDNADLAISKMKSLSANIQDGTYDAGLLGQADLAPLQQALDAAIQRTQQLADAAKQAKDQFSSLGDQLQDDLDSASGNDSAVEDRRFQKQLDDLKAAAQAAGELSSQQYQKDVANANALHDLKLKQIQQQQDAQNGSSTSNPSAPKPNGSAALGGTGAAIPVRYVQHTFKTPDGNINALVADNESDHFESFVTELARAKSNSI